MEQEVERQVHVVPGDANDERGGARLRLGKLCTGDTHLFGMGRGACAARRPTALRGSALKPVGTKAAKRGIKAVGRSESESESASFSYVPQAFLPEAVARPQAQRPVPNPLA